MQPPPLEYDFLAPQRIVFGWGRRREIGRCAAELGRRAFIVLGSRTLEKSGVKAEIFAQLEGAGVKPIHVASISDEPEVAHVDRLLAELQQHSPGAGDLVIGIGGGSAIDLAKAAAALATNRESSSVKDYLEGVGRGLKIVHPPLPMLAVPTTAGTGSEATKNSVISSYSPPFKKSLRSDLMVPRCVLVDPELTVSVPPEITAHTGMDAITQLVESYISRRAKPIPQAISLHGLQLALPALPAAYRDGACRWAREAIAHAALLSGMALANSGLGIAHGVAAALGAECRVRHGLACAVMLPTALRFNRSVCETQYAQMERAIAANTEGRLKPQSDQQAAEAFIARIDQLSQSLSIPGKLRELNVQLAQLPALVAGSQGNSLSGNPRSVSDGELSALLHAIW